ncbi:acyl carrier protein [Photobacterium kishitanii]|uniref:phosphopantetheine-binding protein n=1 Tax=Photobacterium kishitanii TaxID=318456 RepID=UPI0005D425A3|nr:phosphopantetheine-binding protein [Photobacterium kishitanii]KJG09218.1 hypothetical protein UB40_13745 [Photobacterium kishitanii]PSV05529.1 acyl carrier protein [Photobacterium kishitanii]PSV72607.1 acyl carrier protein [Photobacterium kishitanii]
MSTESKLLEIIAEIIEVEIEDISLDTELNEENWDSLAVITFISEVDSEFDMVVSPSKVSEVSKISDLLELIENNK